MTERQIQKELERQKVLFEEECKKGFQSKAVKFETLGEEWFEEYAKTNLRHTTYTYLYHQRLRIYKALGHIRMDKMTSRQIQAFINSLSKDGANEINGKPLSPKSIRHNLNLISDIFGYGIKMGVVTDNPCKNVTVPKNQPKEKEIYTPEEANHILMLLNDEPLKIAPFSPLRSTAVSGAENFSAWNGKTLTLRTTLSAFAERRATRPTAGYTRTRLKLASPSAP